MLEHVVSEGASSSWVVLATVVVVSVVAIYVLWRHHPSYGANPGLPTFPLVGCVPLILLNKHRFYEWTSEIFDNTPSLTCRVMIGGSITIATANPQNVQHILKTNFDCYPKGPSFYPYFADLLGSGIFNCDGPLWRFQRKVASHEFTSNSLKDFVIEIADAEICHRLLPALHSACGSSRGFVDLQVLFMQYTFDTICQLTFGADPACLGSSKSIKSDARHRDAIMGSPKDMGHGEDDNDDDAMRGSPKNMGHGEDDNDDDAMRSHKDMDDGEDDNDNDNGSTKSIGSHGEDVDHAIIGSIGLHGGDHSMMNDVITDPLDMKDFDDLIQGFVQGFQVALQVTADRFLTPDFIWQTKRSLRIGSEKQLLDALEAVSKFSSFVIERSKRELFSGKERKDLLSRFMRLSKPQVGSLLDDQDETANDDEHEQSVSDSLLKDILLSFILAGRESVASGVTFLTWLLCLHPRVEKAVYEEIKGILKARESKPLHGTDCNVTAKVGTFSFDELRKMNYLQAALSESMRLYPPAPSDCKYAAQDDTLPDGTQVLKGYQVSYNVFAMGRAERVWGKDCLEFRPERWLGEDGQFVPASPYKYPVFQAGPRICLGKDFAFIQMKLLIASLVRDFEFKVCPGFKPKLSYGVNLTMVNGLPVTLKRRPESL